jgi:deazaflavin-dependent oxidoreductase (nitroreductase family)
MVGAMTVKVPPKGTRGTGFPRFMARVGSGFGAWLFRRGVGRSVGGTPTLILETRGAKSGQVRQAILGYLAEPPDAWLIVASMGGGPSNPGWLHNLAHDSDATIDLGDQRIQVRAETLEGPELEAAWRRVETEARQYADYRPKTDREIAVIRLRRRSGG